MMQNDIELQDNAISQRFNANLNYLEKSNENQISNRSVTQPSQYLIQNNQYYSDSPGRIIKNRSNSNARNKNPFRINTIKQSFIHNMQTQGPVCNNQKCKICKLALNGRHQIKYYHHKKIKPPLPPLPKLKSSSMRKYQTEPEYLQNRLKPRKVRSVAEVIQDLYVHQQPSIKYKNRYNPDYVRYKVPTRDFYTEADENLRKIYQINGRLYQPIQQTVEKSYELPNPIVRQKKPQVVEFIQPILKYSEKWKNQQVEKVKLRQQLNKWASQYIDYQTIYFRQSCGFAFDFNPQSIKLSPKSRSQNVQRFKVKNYNKQIQKLPMNQDQEDSENKAIQSVPLIQNIMQIIPIQKAEDKIQSKYHQNTKNQQPQNSQNDEINQIYDIQFPQITKIEESIQQYESITGNIDISKLKKSKNYFRQYSHQVGKQFLYFGQYDHRNAQRSGLGVLVTKKYILEGQWHKNFITQGAQLREKFLYKGKFKNNKKHGDGTCKWSNGEQYIGQWQASFKNGHGFWTSANKKQTYSGQWKKGKVTGFGEYSVKNRSLYKGFFIDFRKNGHGIQEFLNGDRFQGDFQNGYPSGKGQYSWQCGLKYVGQFKKGCREGKGSLKKQQFFQIQGYFQKEKPHGICRLVLTNGDVFNGKFIFGQKYGYGTQQYNNSGIKQQGFWNHDVLQQKLSLQAFLKKNQ